MNVFDRIDAVLPSLQGWCEPEKAHALAAAVIAFKPTRIVEVGVFGGRSLIPMALACQANGKGVVIGIDPWTNAAAVDGYDGANRDWWATVDLERVYREFVNHVSMLSLGSFVEVVRAKSDDAPVAASYDMAHLDGQHTDQAVRDVHKFASRVRIGGLCILDDIGWVNGSGTKVGTAVDVLTRNGYEELYRIGTGAVFQRVA